MNPNLPVGGSTADLLAGIRQALPEDVTQLSLTQAWAHFGRAHRSTARADDIATVDAVIATLGVRHYFGGGWSADAALPAGSVRLDPGGDEPPSRLTGLGDAEVGGAYDFSALWRPGGYRPSLRLRLAVGLPTGKEGGEAHDVPNDPNMPHETDPVLLSLGLASWSGIAELTATQFVHKRIALTVPLVARIPLSDTEQGRDFGNVFRFGATAVVLLHDRFVASAGLEHERRGYTQEQGEGRLVNSGADVTRAVVSASVRMSDRLALFLGAGFPVRVDANGTQITESFLVHGGLTLTFDGVGKDRDDGGHKH